MKLPFYSYFLIAFLLISGISFWAYRMGVNETEAHFSEAESIFIADLNYNVCGKVVAVNPYYQKWGFGTIDCLIETGLNSLDIQRESKLRRELGFDYNIDFLVKIENEVARFEVDAVSLFEVGDSICINTDSTHIKLFRGANLKRILAINLCREC